MKTANKIRSVLLLIVMLCSLALFIIFKDQILGFLSQLSDGTIDEVIVLIRSWGPAAPLLSVLLMMLQAVAFPIPSFLISGANGAVFGIFPGFVISWIGGMFGGALAYMLARLLGERFVRKMISSKGLWEKVDEINSLHGVKVVLIARLLPFVSFDFISYAAGLSCMKFNKFLLATGIGMIPGSFAYVYLGHEMTAYKTFTTAMTITGSVLLLLYVLYRLFRKLNSKKKEQKNTTLPPE
ncbi:MAG: TVP38/TMEM64 family protein [Spirochaetia bacterium]|nr:TVP38/TMEM64 family protein [Spirochaetia bacterium]